MALFCVKRHTQEVKRHLATTHKQSKGGYSYKFAVKKRTIARGRYVYKAFKC